MNDAQDKMLEKLYREMYQNLIVYAYCSLKSETLAEEAVQETFRIACTKIDQLVQSRNPQGWLMNTLKNVLSNMKRSRARLSALAAASLSVDEVKTEAGQDEIDVDILYGDIAKHRDYIMIKKIALEDYSMLELSQEFHITLEACKKRVQRARKKLREKIEKNSE